MYKVKVSYGYDIYEPDEAGAGTEDILGPYETRYAADWAARDKFDAIMERLGDDIEACFRDIQRHYCDYYVVYGYIELELGYVDNEHYYRVSVIEG